MTPSKIPRPVSPRADWRTWVIPAAVMLLLSCSVNSFGTIA